MSCPRAWHARVLQWVYGKKNIKKNHMEKDYCKLQCFQEKKLQS